MIILGKFSHCVVKCARFKGTTMSVFTDKKEYDGDIFSILENTQSFVLNHINLRGEIKGLQRTDTYEIPVSALREALINAIIHRDYINRGRDIKVGIYDDVVNIVSPGSLPHSITIEDVFNGRSEARNRVVAHVFKELNLIEQWGSGINRIMNDCKAYELQTPKIEEKNDFFDVEIIRPVPTESDQVQQHMPHQQEHYWQQELQQEFKALLEQGLEDEQQELQQELHQELEQELQQESLYGKVLGKLLQGALSTQEVSTALGQKSISGQLYTVINKLREDDLIKWTIPDKPKSSKQKYKLTKRGLAFYALVRKKEKA